MSGPKFHNPLRNLVKHSESCQVPDTVRLELLVLLQVDQGRLSPLSPMFVSFGQDQLLVRDGEAPYVPKYPEDQAEEYKQGPGQHKEVPETERCKDPQQKDDETNDVKNKRQDQEEDAAAPILGAIHGRDTGDDRVAVG